MTQERWIKLAVKLAEKNMSMVDLASATGIHTKTIYRGMKLGPSVMRMSTLDRIAEYFEIEVKELL